MDRNKIEQLISGIRTINRGSHHEVPEQFTGDDEPCYWQRSEWVEWILELANEAEQANAKLTAERDALVEAVKRIAFEIEEFSLTGGFSQYALDLVSEALTQEDKGDA